MLSRESKRIYDPIMGPEGSQLVWFPADLLGCLLTPVHRVHRVGLVGDAGHVALMSSPQSGGKLPN
jgi:hypothetical protein